MSNRRRMAEARRIQAGATVPLNTPSTPKGFHLDRPDRLCPRRTRRVVRGGRYRGLLWHHAGFPSGRLTSSNVGTWMVPNQDPSVSPADFTGCVTGVRHQELCFSAFGTQHRNRIGRVSPFSEYAPTAGLIKLKP